MDRLLAEREAGSQWRYRALGHRGFSQAAGYDDVLLCRLTCTRTLETSQSSYPVNVVSWDETGSQLVSGGSDHRVKLWDAHSARLYTYDPGHTLGLYCAEFMPGTGMLATGAGDKQLRVSDINRMRVKPFYAHTGRVRALAAVTSHVLLSGSEDGTVRQFDIREAKATRAPPAQGDAPADVQSLLVDQRAESAMQWGGPHVGVQSLSIDPMAPWLFATGGNDTLVRVYDRRMLRAPERSARAYARASTPQWCYALVPEHLRQPAAPQLFMSIPQVTGISFSHSGRQLLASYSGEHIYSFGTEQHGRSYDQLFSRSSGTATSAVPSSAPGRRRGRGSGSTIPAAAAGAAAAGAAAPAALGNHPMQAAAATFAMPPGVTMGNGAVARLQGLSNALAANMAAQLGPGVEVTTSTTFMYVDEQGNMRQYEQQHGGGQREQQLQQQQEGRPADAAQRQQRRQRRQQLQRGQELATLAADAGPGAVQGGERAVRRSTRAAARAQAAGTGAPSAPGPGDTLQAAAQLSEHEGHEGEDEPQQQQPQRRRLRRMRRPSQEADVEGDEPAAARRRPGTPRPPAMQPDDMQDDSMDDGELDAAYADMFGTMPPELAVQQLEEQLEEEQRQTQQLQQELQRHQQQHVEQEARLQELTQRRQALRAELQHNQARLRQLQLEGAAGPFGFMPFPPPPPPPQLMARLMQAGRTHAAPAGAAAAGNAQWQPMGGAQPGGAASDSETHGSMPELATDSDTDAGSDFSDMDDPDAGRAAFGLQGLDEAAHSLHASQGTQHAAGRGDDGSHSDAVEEPPARRRRLAQPRQQRQRQQQQQQQQQAGPAAAAGAPGSFGHMLAQPLNHMMSMMRGMMQPAAAADGEQGPAGTPLPGSTPSQQAAAQDAPATAAEPRGIFWHRSEPPPAPGSAERQDEQQQQQAERRPRSRQRPRTAVAQQQQQQQRRQQQQPPGMDMPTGMLPFFQMGQGLFRPENVQMLPVPANMGGPDAGIILRFELDVPSILAGLAGLDGDPNQEAETMNAAQAAAATEGEGARRARRRSAAATGTRATAAPGQQRQRQRRQQQQPQQQQGLDPGSRRSSRWVAGGTPPTVSADVDAAGTSRPPAAGASEPAAAAQPTRRRSRRLTPSADANDNSHPSDAAVGAGAVAPDAADGAGAVAPRPPKRRRTGAQHSTADADVPAQGQRDAATATEPPAQAQTAAAGTDRPSREPSGSIGDGTGFSAMLQRMLSQLMPSLTGTDHTGTAPQAMQQQQEQQQQQQPPQQAAPASRPPPSATMPSPAAAQDAAAAASTPVAAAPLPTAVGAPATAFTEGARGTQGQAAPRPARPSSGGLGILRGIFGRRSASAAAPAAPPTAPAPAQPSAQPQAAAAQQPWMPLPMQLPHQQPPFPTVAHLPQALSQLFTQPFPAPPPNTDAAFISQLLGGPQATAAVAPAPGIGGTSSPAAPRGRATAFRGTQRRQQAEGYGNPALMSVNRVSPTMPPHSSAAAGSAGPEAEESAGAATNPWRRQRSSRLARTTGGGGDDDGDDGGDDDGSDDDGDSRFGHGPSISGDGGDDGDGSDDDDVEGGSSGSGNSSYLQCYKGHRNCVTDKNVAWMGPRGEYVMSGSDDGNVFIWEASSGRVVNVLVGDSGFAVTCVKAHPSIPMLASAAQEPTVRLWSPEAEEPSDLSHIPGIIAANEGGNHPRRARTHMIAQLLNGLGLGLMSELMGAATGETGLEEADIGNVNVAGEPRTPPGPRTPARL